MKRWRILFFLCAASLLLGCNTATALPIVLYNLLPGTSFQEGCGGPCMCPVMASGNVKGTFGVVSSGGVGQTKALPATMSYKLRDIAWTVFDTTGQVIHTITGEGTYQYRRVGVGVVKQQLTLKISIDGQDPISLDSGQLVGYGRFPAFAVSARSDTGCFEVEMDIVAARAPLTAVKQQ